MSRRRAVIRSTFGALVVLSSYARRRKSPRRYREFWQPAGDGSVSYAPSGSGTYPRALMSPVPLPAMPFTPGSTSCCPTDKRDDAWEHQSQDDAPVFRDSGTARVVLLGPVERRHVEAVSEAEERTAVEEFAARVGGVNGSTSGRVTTPAAVSPPVRQLGPPLAVVTSTSAPRQPRMEGSAGFQLRGIVTMADRSAEQLRPVSRTRPHRDAARSQGSPLGGVTSDLGRSIDDRQPRDALSWGRRVANVERMTIQRMEHVGIVVDDLAAATAFFGELGAKLQGEGPVRGGWVDRMVGLEGVRAQVAMVETPDGHGRLELTKFHAPSGRGGDRPRAGEQPGASAMLHSQSTTSKPWSIACAPAARSSIGEVADDLASGSGRSRADSTFAMARPVRCRADVVPTSGTR
jgi:catechol 2,3-dioxygenase-like lactoylglutathione lyase family enzyme